jgi:hypothetical protein
MFKVKCETRDYKYFLKLGDNEVCLSSETPKDIYNDNDIEDIVNRALEAYHEYVFSKFREEYQKYIPQAYTQTIDVLKHDRQPYIQKLLKLGIIYHCDTIQSSDDNMVKRIYDISKQYIIKHATNINFEMATICTLNENYNMAYGFENFTCSFCNDEYEDVIVHINGLLIYKLTEVS